MERQAYRVRQLPEAISSPRAKLIYLYLATTGEATIDDLNRNLGVSKLALLGTLDALVEQEIVRTEGAHYACE